VSGGGGETLFGMGRGERRTGKRYILSVKAYEVKEENNEDSKKGEKIL